MVVSSLKVLIIFDGLGILKDQEHNAVMQAYTPNLDKLKLKYFYTTLQAAGIFVGLPQGYCGNSQVGHFTIGAGKIIQQTTTRLHVQLSQQNICQNSTLSDLLKNFNTTCRIHLLGMASDGNIHSNLQHARALIYAINQLTTARLFVHLFLDGRDVPPCSALAYITAIKKDLDQYKIGQIASIHGRFYAMDRNKNYDRTEKSFAILTNPSLDIFDYEEHILKNYEKGITDEFIKPFACTPDHIILPGDGVIFFNFRPDRAIQLTEKLLTLDLAFFITPVVYHDSLQTTPLISEVIADNSLLEILSAHHKTIFTIAETEKYAHISYFFNGHKDIVWPGETRVLIPSLLTEPKYAPKMQAEMITQTVIASLEDDAKDFYLINYANADMVGHTGDLQATITAIEFLDEQLGILYQEVVIKRKGTLIVTADHGNAELMFDTNSGQACTSHTANPVPFYLISDDPVIQQKGAAWQGVGLADIAPLIIDIMNL